MIDPERLDVGGYRPLENPLMDDRENLGVLNSNPSKLGHVKEATVINFLRGDSPVSEAVDLLFKEGVKSVEASRITLRPGKRSHVLVQELS